MDTPLDELQWKSPEWIQAFGLRTDNVLDYFAESPFFDKTSNNHVIKMQRQFSQLPQDGTNGQVHGQQFTDQNGVLQGTSLNGPSNEFGHLDEMRKDVLKKYPVHAMLERELVKLKGIEYVLYNVREPDFWIIKKQQRFAPDRVQYLQDYYIIGANVYQSPTIFKIVQSRMMSTSHYLSQSISNLQKLTQFQPSQGVHFKNPNDRSFGSSQAGNGNSTGNVGGSVPTTVMTNGPSSTLASAQTEQSGMTARLDNNDSSMQREIITKEMMDKLMLTSIKSKPEYIQ